MSIRYSTQGLILKETDRGEADRIFAIYTKDFGKIKILGKSIRKIKSKLRQGAVMLCLSDIEFIQGKNHKTLTDASPEEKFTELRKSFEKTKIACKIADNLDSLIIKEEKDDGIWELIGETFRKLNSGAEFSDNSRSKPGRQFQGFSIYYYFLWRLFSCLGYGPELYNCSLCQKKLTPAAVYFSPKEGGTVCPDCASKTSLIPSADIDLVKILRLILKQDWETFRRIKIEKKHRELLNNVSKEYFEHILVKD